MSIELFLALLMILFSAFFSGSEIAFLASSKLKIELKSVQGSRRGKILSGFVKNTSRYITAILIGNNLALVIYGLCLPVVLSPFVSTWLSIPESDRFGMLIPVTAISTLIILIFGEYLPKAIFRINPDRALFAVAHLMRFFYVVFWPLIWAITSLSTFFLRNVFRVPHQEQEIEFTKGDLAVFVQENLRESDAQLSQDIDQELFANAMEFNKIKARECMIPRTEIEGISVNAGIQALLDKFIHTEHSRIIVYREDLDEILGYAHSSSMFKNPGRIQDILKPVIMVPESMPANMLLTEFTNQRTAIAVVVDEFGGTEGIVTLEDLVEEVFGEIEDEHDMPEEDELLAKKTGPNTWIFNARVEVDIAKKEHGIPLPEGDYNTLGGLVLFHTEAIPHVNDELLVGNCRITILESSENKVDKVKIEVL